MTPTDPHTRPGPAAGTDATPSAPGATTDPDTPSAPGATTDPDTPSAPGATTDPDMPSAPGATTDPDMPSAPGATTDPDMPSAPGATTDPRTLGELIRAQREELRRDDVAYSVRQVAERLGVQASYLSKVERDIGSPPSEETLVRLAADLGLDADLVLAYAGKISRDVRETIRRRPQLFAQLIRELKDMPDHAVLRLVREVRDGEW